MQNDPFNPVLGAESQRRRGNPDVWGRTEAADASTGANPIESDDIDLIADLLTDDGGVL